MSFQPAADGHVTAPTRGHAAVDVPPQPPWTARFRSEALISGRKAPFQGPPCRVEGFATCLTPPAALGQACTVVELWSEGRKKLI